MDSLNPTFSKDIGNTKFFSLYILIINEIELTIWEAHNQLIPAEFCIFSGILTAK
jgi:hypothetical protein